MRVDERLMMISAIFWQPNERLLTVRTAAGEHVQIGGRLSDQELVDVLGQNLADRVSEVGRHAPELSDLAVHALRGDDLGYLSMHYEHGKVRVVPVRVTQEGNRVPDDTEQDWDDACPGFKM